MALTGNTPGPESEYRPALNRNNQWPSRLQILSDKLHEFHLSTRRPSSAHVSSTTANGRAHKRKLAIVDHHFEVSERWLTAGYIDWIVGPASQRMPLEQVDVLAASLVTILEAWYRIEVMARVNQDTRKELEE